MNDKYLYEKYRKISTKYIKDSLAKGGLTEEAYEVLVQIIRERDLSGEEVNNVSSGVKALKKTASPKLPFLLRPELLVVRFIMLAFFVAFGWSMAILPANEINNFGKLMGGQFIVSAPMLYFLPVIEAYLRKQSNLESIAVVNIFLGWTLFGWVIALVWAIKKPERQNAITENERSVTLTVAPKNKNCPYCAEEVLFAAIKCKHCGSSLS